MPDIRLGYLNVRDPRKDPHRIVGIIVLDIAQEGHAHIGVGFIQRHVVDDGE